MRPPLRSLAVLILAAAVPAVSPAQPTFAHSFGGIKVSAGANAFLPAAATGDNCVYADANGVVAGAATYVNVPALPAGAPPPACTITYTSLPLSALGPLAGFGRFGVAKFPPPPGTGSFDAALNGITAGGVTATARASWTSSETVLPGVGAFRDASLFVRTNVVGKPGLAAAISEDPWFFFPTQDVDLDLSATLLGLDLAAQAEPGAAAVAQFEALAAFGLGSVPGSNTQRTFAPFLKVVHSGASPYQVAEQPFFSATLPLRANQTYWLTVSARAAARTTPVPEPGSASLCACGLLAVVVRRALRRRPHGRR